MQLKSNVVTLVAANVSIPQAVSTVATLNAPVDALPAISSVSIPQAVSTVAT